MPREERRRDRPCHSGAVEMRDRTNDDVDACARIARLVHDRDGYPPRLVEDLRRFLVSPRALGAWVAVEDGEVVGHVALHPTSSVQVVAAACEALGIAADGLAVIARLLVAPDRRRRGIADGLLVTATRAATGLGRHAILDVPTHFAPAVALYERAGWSRVAQVTVTIAGTEPLDEYVYVAPVPSKR